MWHLHRLALLKYADYCRERFGSLVEPGTSSFRLQTVCAGADSDDCVKTRGAWASAYPTEPFFCADESPVIVDTRESSLVQPIIATAQRQSSFLWQVSGAGFSDDRFLQTAIERYDKFLRLMGTHGYRQHFYVPSYDVDLCWHTHMLVSSAAYLEETQVRAGESVDHDDSVNQRYEGSKLTTSWANTKQLWRQTYGDSDETEALDVGGTCYRGEPPAWWFSDRRSKQRVQVHEEALAAEQCQQLVVQLACQASDVASVQTDLKMSLQVPISMYDGIKSVLRVGGTWPAVSPTEVLTPQTEMVQVPAKISNKAVPLHQVKSKSRSQ